ncbi:hypothetical protein ENUP19_0036G0064 [Entamoeba nuttalli]|uniref:AIG1-type G domain-containing protein n=1 Tax=Entamoeba nuttalli TaxID=412467 RepID=A0ABQ0D9E7_9EUKA
MSRIIVRFLLNGKCVATKPLISQDSLKTARDKLKEKISDSQHFLTKDGDVIGVNDEEYFTVQDVIAESRIINIKGTEDKKGIRIKINDKIITTIEIDNKTPLSDVRKIVQNILESACFYTLDNDKVERDEEDAYTNHENGKLKIYLYPNQQFNQKDENAAIGILVVGQTGSVKTTLLNSFVNALYGIKLTDDFRYIIINEDHLKQYGDKSVSQRSQVTIYNIKRTKRTPPIKIINTPGFGDTRGIAYDREITKQIKEAFETKVLDLNAICFVAPSSNVKLTVSQKYIFGNIINLFGKDVKKNFIAMITFCDGKTPQVINSLQSKECIFSTIIPEIDSPWYLKFNNSAIYDDNTEDEFTQMFWKLGMKNFDDFITKLVKLPRISLEQSREVLRKREQIKTQLEGLRISLNNGLSKMNDLKQIYKQLYLNRDKVKNNENFTFTVDIPVQKIVDLKSGEYATNCLKCNKTCHYPCYIPDIKRGYSCIGDNGYCKVCGCNSSQHANSSYRFDYVIEKKQETAKEVFDRYNKGKKCVANAESILKKLEEEYYNIQMECYDKEQEIIECVNKLSEIALNGKVTSSNEYLDILIQIKEEEKKDGYEVRIEGYKKLKRVNDIIEDIMKNSATKKEKGRN